jgi:predicted aldo/keto reductase-like oxidoreductase
MRQLEESLNRLQTDHLDILQIHLIRSLEDVDAICAEDGVLKVLQKAKDEKVARFIGFTGHLDAQAMTEMQNRYNFDTMLIALNHYTEHKGDFEKDAIPAAAEKEMGVLVMKVIRPKETVEGVTPEELIRYALSLEHVSAAAIGMDSLDVLKKNIDLAKNFQKMSPAEMQNMTATLRPFFKGQNLFWMNPKYTDGIPA